MNRSYPPLNFTLRRSVTHPSPLLFFFTVIYAKCIRSDRSLQWLDLLTFHSTLGHSDPWLLCGDFNVISSIEECRGFSSPDQGSMTDFNEFIASASLHHINSVGPLFTWTGMRPLGRVWKRLNRFLYNSSWLQTFPSATV